MLEQDVQEGKAQLRFIKLGLDDPHGNGDLYQEYGFFDDVWGRPGEGEKFEDGGLPEDEGVWQGPSSSSG